MTILNLIAARPRLKPERRAELEDAIRHQSRKVADLQREFGLSRRRIYEIRRTLKL